MLEGGAHGALGVVLVGDGCTEQRHDRVADDLVDPATEASMSATQLLEAAVDEVLHVLGIARSRTAR